MASFVEDMQFPFSGLPAQTPYFSVGQGDPKPNLNFVEI